MRKPDCLRCQVTMNHVITEKIQLGQTGWFLGDLPNLIAGAMEVSIFACPQCGKLEFFQAEGKEDPQADRIAQVKCPKCGKVHDMDYPKCPFCKHSYYD